MLSKKTFLFALIAALLTSGTVFAATVTLDKDTGTISEAGANAVLSILPKYTGSESGFVLKFKFNDDSAKLEDIVLPLPSTIACVKNFDGDATLPLPEISVALKPGKLNEWNFTFSSYDASALACGGAGSNPLDPPATGCEFKCDLTVSAVDDDIDEGDVKESFKFELAASDDDADSKDSETFEILDNDHAAIIVSDAEFTGPYPYDPPPFPALSTKNTTEADPSLPDTFYVELATEPDMGGKDKIEVKVKIPDAFKTEASFSNDDSEDKEIKLQFTKANWNVGQLVSVYGRDDAPQNPVDGTQQGNLTVTTDGGADDSEYKNLAGPQVTVENADNDVPGKVRIKSTSTSLVVDETGANNEAVVTLERVDGSSGAITVDYIVAHGVTNPTKDGDYTDNSGGSVSWTNGDSADKTILIDIVDDTWLEGSENFTVTISDPPGTAPEDLVTVSPKISNVTINSNDNISFEVASASETEGDVGNTPVVLAVTPSGGTVEEGGDPIVLGCSTSPGSTNPASAGSDYVSSCSGFSYGFGDSAPSLTVNIIGDEEGEVDETFNVNLTGAPAQVSTISGVVTIDDDETGQARIKAGTTLYSEDEGDVVTVTLQRVGGSADELSVTYSFSDTSTKVADRTDTSGYSGTVVWADNEEDERDITISLVDDNFLEGDEGFFLNLEVSGKTQPPRTSAITINANDNITFAVTNVSKPEGNVGTVPHTVPVTRTGGVLEAGAPPIVLGCATTDGTSANPATTADNDYLAACTGFSFGPAGANPPNPEVTVSIIGDLKDENNEEFTVSLTGAPVQVITSSGEVTITDDDDPIANAVSIVDVSPVSPVAEDVGTVTVTLQRNPADLSGEVAVYYYTVDGSAKACPADPCVDAADNDFVGIADDEDPITHRILWANNDGDDKTFTVTIYDDTVEEDLQDFTVNIKPAHTDDELAVDPLPDPLPPPATTIGTGQATVQIAANDAPGTARIKAGSVNKSGDEGSTVTITLERVGGDVGPLDVTYTLSTNVDTLTADRTDTSGVPGTVSWAAGNDDDQNVTISLTDDSWLEGDEFFTLTLEDSDKTDAPLESNIKINKNDDINFRVEPVSQAEGDSSTSNFALAVTNTTGGTVEVGKPPIVLGCSTTAGSPPATAGVDYVSGCADFSYGSDGVLPTITVVVNGDTDPESDEKVIVSLTGAPEQVTTEPGTLTIENDDDVDVSIKEVLPANPVSEGAGTVNVTLQREGDTSGAVSVYYYTLSNTATNCSGACNEGDNDFTAIPMDTLSHTWPDGNNDDFTFPVTLIDDSAAEDLEDFTVNIKAVDPGTIVGLSTATIEIAGNDQAGTIAINPDNYLVNEDAGTVMITVERTPPDATGTATVVYWTEDDVAVSCETLPPTCTPATDGDFENIPESAGNTLVFPTGGSMTFTVNIHSDALTEGAESFNVRIKEADGPASGATVVTDPATVTIAANGGEINTPGVISVAPSFYSRNEAQEFVEVQLNRTGGTLGKVGVTAYTTNDTAVAPGDFDEILAQTVEWEAGDAAPKFVTVMGFDDGVPVDDPSEAISELFTVSIKDATGGASISSSAHTATVEIRDEEILSAGTISIIASDNVSEGDGTIDVKVSRVGGFNGAVQVDYVTRSDQATGAIGGAADDDYLYKTGTLVWPDGNDDDQFVTVSLVDDTTIEGSEIFYIDLSDPKGQDEGGNPVDEGAPELGTATSEITIYDNDGAGDFSIDDVWVIEGNPPNQAMLTITRSNDNDSAVTLTVKTFDGSAKAGEDYAATSTTVVWGPGDTDDEKYVYVDIFVNESGVEWKIEDFFVAITSFVGEGVAIRDGVGEVLIIKVTTIPTLSEWALILMALLMGWVGISRLRKTSMTIS